MLSSNIKLLLLLIVIIIFLQRCFFNNDIVEGVTFIWDTYGTQSSITHPIPKNNNDCETKTGIKGVTECIVSSDNCVNKNEGDNCHIHDNINGTCKKIKQKLLCYIESSSVINNIKDSIKNQKKKKVESNTNSYYVIKKNNIDKTHSPVCIESKSTKCNDLINDNSKCNADTKECCLCNKGKWNSIYTSNFNDNLQGKSLNVSDSNNLFKSISDKKDYSIVQLKDPTLGIITNKTGNNHRRYFNLSKKISNYTGDSKYAPSKGYFFKIWNDNIPVSEEIYPLNQFPDYIASSENTQMGNNFFYEECLYKNKKGSCVCEEDYHPSSKTPINNHLCKACPSGTVGNSSGSACLSCSDNNMVTTEVTNKDGNKVKKCVPCLPINKINKIYSDGKCKDLSNKNIIVRSDCINRNNPPKGTNKKCNVTHYMDEKSPKSSSQSIYHLSDKTSKHSLNDYYKACASSDTGGGSYCKVVQNIVSDIEGYINFNAPSEKTPNSLKHENKEYNMITNLFCKEISEKNECNKLKQCKWRNNKTCLLNTDNIKNEYNIKDSLYIHIPIPDTLSTSSTIENTLSTECSGRIKSDCLIKDNGCKWSQKDKSCKSSCVTKTETECNNDNRCNWESKDSICSRKSRKELECPPPSMLPSMYKQITKTSYGRRHSEDGIKDKISCNHDNINYSGQFKGFCLEKNKEKPVKPTGCVSSTSINNLVLFKNINQINKESTIASKTLNKNIPGKVSELIRDCAQLCKEDNLCLDYGVKFPTSFSKNTDEGCYIKHKKSINRVSINVKFEKTVVIEHGIKYYPCKITLENINTQLKLKNIVGIVGLGKKSPLILPYFYRLYNPIAKSSKTIKDFDISIPGISSNKNYTMHKLSDETKKYDTLSILLSLCIPKSNIKNPTPKNYNDCYLDDFNFSDNNIDLILTNRDPIKIPLMATYKDKKNRETSQKVFKDIDAYNLKKQWDGYNICHHITRNSKCKKKYKYDDIGGINGPFIDNIKQFTFGSESSETYLYNEDSKSYKNIIHLKDDNIWNKNKKNKGLLIKPQKLEINNGGILKNNSKDNNLQINTKLDIMKLYLLEGEDDIKFNLVGKREKNSDWFIKDIVLNIKNNKGKPTDFSIEKTIEFIS